jgi:hypothetical protein
MGPFANGLWIKCGAWAIFAFITLGDVWRLLG